jgi:hypothetical protein
MSLNGYNPEGARRARDEAIARVLANSGAWKDRAQELVSALCACGRPEDRFLGEDLRRVMSPVIGEPRNHPNAWGGMCNTAVIHGVIVAVGKYGPCAKITTHRRKTMTYRWGMPWIEPPKKARKKKGDRIQ